MSFAERAHPEVGDPVLGTVSVGSVATGHLVNGRPVPFSGLHHTVLEEHRKRATNYGTDELVELVLEGALKAAEVFPGAKLAVGNVSRGGGGDIPWSISHNCGRDVDLGFYLLDEAGEQVVLPTLAPLQAPRGTIEFEGRALEFDPARNWTMVKALLDSKIAQVQYIFCADFLIKRMFEYARAQGVKERYLDSLSGVLRQPRGTLPHDDHMHVRATCSDGDLAEGCRDIVGGRERVPGSHPQYARRVSELWAIVSDEGSTERRAAALLLLGLLKVRRDHGKLYDALEGCEEPVCLAGVTALETVGARVRAEPLVDVLKRTGEPKTAAIAFRLLRRGRSGTVRRVLPLLRDGRRLVGPHYFFERELTVREEACHCLGWLGRREAVPHLLELVTNDDDPGVRSAALWAVRVISGGEVFDDEILEERPKDLKKKWKRWSRRNRKEGKALRRALRDRGYKVDKLSRAEAGELVRAVGDSEDHISMNSQRLLNKLFKEDLPVNIKDRAHAHWLWRKQLKRFRLRGR